ncbi:MAG: hypothetical protein ACRCZ2_04695 [Fusobacteriaceae bacterium]
MSYQNNGNNNAAPKWVEIASAWKGVILQSGEESLSIKIKQGISVTLTSETKINLYVNKNKDFNNLADSKKPDFRVMVPNDGSVVPVQAAKTPTNNTNNGYSKPANNSEYNNNYSKPADKPNNAYNSGGYKTSNQNNNYSKPAYDANKYSQNNYGQQNASPSPTPAYNAPPVTYDDTDLPSF